MMTASEYAYAGLFTVRSMALIPWIVPSILGGVPLGAFVIQRVRVETFRRVCMSFDAYVVAFGLSRLLGELHLIESAAAYLLLVPVSVLDTGLLYPFFSAPRVDQGVREGDHFSGLRGGRVSVPAG